MGTSSDYQQRERKEYSLSDYDYAQRLHQLPATQADYPSLDKDLEMLQLELAAQANDETAFISAANSMDWTRRPVEDILRAVQLALQAWAHLKARNLSMQGAAIHPENEDLLKYAHILAPPKVISTNLPAKPEAGADIQWLKQHGDDYRGRWVALHSGELLAEADSFFGIIEQIGNPRGTGILVTKVY